MTVTSAEVQTLTAEVRVLIVGNRQVTMSLARQLDIVPPTCISPFGRIDLHYPGIKYRGGVRVIGKDTVNGALAVSHAVNIQDDLYRAAPEFVYWNDTYAPGYEMSIDREEMESFYTTWRALPLIVLAGLH